MNKSHIIIPALNEEASIAQVIKDIPMEHISEVIVVDNGSTDDTAKVAELAGAKVLHENERGYGAACLRGLKYIKELEPQPLFVAFIDGDYADDPTELSKLIQPILNDEADLVIGSRVLGKREKGALLPQAIFGNWLASTLIRLLYGVKFTDLGPFRVIRYSSLCQLNMQDRNYGWTVEMQVKAAKHALRCIEVPVRYKKRIGESKISGTLSGSIKAGNKILYTIFRNLFSKSAHS